MFIDYVCQSGGFIDNYSIFILSMNSQLNNCFLVCVRRERVFPSFK